MLLFRPAPHLPNATAWREFLWNDQARADRGVHRLHHAESLTVAAQAEAEAMAREHYFSHVSPDGTTPALRARLAGYPSTFVGENIAMGYTSAAAVTSAWLHSPEHRENMLREIYTDMGVGFARSADGTTYWVVDFGNPNLVAR